MSIPIVTDEMTAGEAALLYASQGIPALPLHFPTSLSSGTGCSCGNSKCGSVAKHPKTAHGLKDANTDLSVIQEWWRKWPQANIGLVTGQASGLVVLDIDIRHAGNEGLKQLENRFGKLPTTLTVKTGGGCHLYFQYPTESSIRSRTQLGGCTGVDVRADGGYVIAPPSVHAAGSLYTVSSDEPIAELPERWVEFLTGETSQSEGGRRVNLDEIKKGVREGERNDAIFRGVCKLRRQGATKEAAQEWAKETARNCDPPLSEAEALYIADGVWSNPEWTPSEDSDETSSRSYVVAWPEPAAPEAFSGLPGDMVRAIEPVTEAHPIALLTQILLMFGFYSGRQAHFVAEADRHYSNVYVLLVGPTAKARKGASYGRVRAFYEELRNWSAAQDRIKDGLSTGEGLINAVRDPDDDDHEPIDRRLLAQAPEFSALLQVMGRRDNTLAATIRQAWDSGDLNVLTRNQPLTATGAHISILGHVTQADLRKYLDQTNLMNGVMNRFLIVCVKRVRTLPESNPVDPQIMKPLVKRLQAAATFAKKVGLVERDEEARQLWIEVYPKLSEGKPGSIGHVTSRAEAQVMRFALIHALMDLSNVIRKEHLEASLALSRYSEASCLYLFGESVGDPEADRLLTELKKAPDGMTRTEIRDHFGRNKDKRFIDNLLAGFVEQDLARCEIEDTGNPRKTERWYAVRH